MSRLAEIEGVLKEQAIEMFGVIAKASIISDTTKKTLLDGVENYRNDHPAFDVVKAYTAERRQRFITNGTLRI